MVKQTHYLTYPRIVHVLFHTLLHSTVQYSTILSNHWSSYSSIVSLMSCIIKLHLLLPFFLIKLPFTYTLLA